MLSSKADSRGEESVRVSMDDFASLALALRGADAVCNACPVSCVIISIRTDAFVQVIVVI